MSNFPSVTSGWYKETQQKVPTNFYFETRSFHFTQVCSHECVDSWLCSDSFVRWMNLVSFLKKDKNVCWCPLVITSTYLRISVCLLYTFWFFSNVIFVWLLIVDMMILKDEEKIMCILTFTDKVPLHMSLNFIKHVQCWRNNGSVLNSFESNYHQIPCANSLFVVFWFQLLEEALGYPSATLPWPPEEDAPHKQSCYRTSGDLLVIRCSINCQSTW